MASVAMSLYSTNRPFPLPPTQFQELHWHALSRATKYMLGAPSASSRRILSLWVGQSVATRAKITNDRLFLNSRFFCSRLFQISDRSSCGLFEQFQPCFSLFKHWQDVMRPKKTDKPRLGNSQHTVQRYRTVWNSY